MIVTDTKDVESFGEVFHAVGGGYDKVLGDDGRPAPMDRITSAATFHAHTHLQEHF